jgi:hypothetical protein
VRNLTLALPVIVEDASFGQEHGRLLALTRGHERRSRLSLYGGLDGRCGLEVAPDRDGEAGDVAEPQEELPPVEESLELR